MASGLTIASSVISGLMRSMVAIAGVGQWSARTLKGELETVYEDNLLPIARLAEVLGTAGLGVTPAEDGRVTVADTTPAAVGAHAFRAGVELHELRAETSGLEELYFRLTAGQEQYAAAPEGGSR